MPKTPEEVIAKLQRRLVNAGAHTIGLVDHLAGAKKDVKRLEDTLVWIHKKLDGQNDPTCREICETIQQKIPTRMSKEKL